MFAEWKSVQQLPELRQNELQLWRIELAETTALLAAFSSVLTASEQEHAARRREGQTRQQFVVGRGSLRLLLGNALGIHPRDVPILAGIHGKPHTPGVGGRSVSYNVAHSKSTILVAVRRHGAVGVDIEHIDPKSDSMEIASRWFTPRETASLAFLPDPNSADSHPNARTNLFFRYWTRKEAIAKADGRGLILSLDSFDVALDTATPEPALIHLSPETGSKLYLLRDLPLGPDFAGALALESPDATITQWAFSPDFAP